MCKRKVLEFVKAHKKELALTAVAVVGGTIIFAVTKKKSDKLTQSVSNIVSKWRDLDSSMINLGTITECNTNGEWIDVIVNDIKVEDLGRFGEELIKLEGVSADTGVSALISLSNEW